MLDSFKRTVIAFEKRREMLDGEEFMFEYKSPQTNEELDFEETLAERILNFNHNNHLCTKNEQIRAKIQIFKEEKLAAPHLQKQTAEGKEKRCIFRMCYGYASRDNGSNQSKENSINSTVKFLDWMGDESTSCLVCLTGPLASGKTVTMQQIVYAAATNCREQMQTRLDTKSVQKMPLLPVFMRAAVLSDLMDKDVGEFAQESSFCNQQSTPSLRQLVELFLRHGVQQGMFPKENVILELFDNGRILVFINGLDEAAGYQELVETSIEHAVKEAVEIGRRVHMLISTREHSYLHSRACLRLGDFSVVSLQPLDDNRRLEMLRRRLTSEQVAFFEEQLIDIEDKHPELITSPFVLSLMIEVYKKDGVIPRKRVDLYAKQIEAIVSQCVKRRIHDGMHCKDFGKYF